MANRILWQTISKALLKFNIYNIHWSPLLHKTRHLILGSYHGEAWFAIGNLYCLSLLGFRCLGMVSRSICSIIFPRTEVRLLRYCFLFFLKVGMMCTFSSRIMDLQGQQQTLPVKAKVRKDRVSTSTFSKYFSFRLVKLFWKKMMCTIHSQRVECHEEEWAFRFRVSYYYWKGNSSDRY